MANSALLRMLGYSSFDALVHRNLEKDDYEPEYSRDEFRTRIERDGEIRGLEAAWRRRDGSVIHVRENARAVRDAHGKILYYEGTVEDVSERRRAEDGLQHTLSLLGATLESTTDGILVVDQTGRITSFNRKFAQMWNIPEEILAARDDDRALAYVLSQLKDPEGFLRKVRELYADPETESYDVLEFNDGRVLERYSQPQRIAGQCVGRVWSFRDVTKRKLAEEQIQRLNTELEGRVQRRTAELAAANRELESFSYSVSHDLRGPLRTIDGFTQAILEDHSGALVPGAAELLHRVRAASRRMAQLIDDLLALSRVTRSEIQRQRVNLSALAQEIVVQLQQEEPSRLVEFEVTPGVSADGDPQLFRIVLENLLGNAWKFTSKHSRARVEFGVLWDEARPVYYVRDDGAGFDRTHAQKLFTPFQRLHRKSEFEGNGIGLATVHRIVQRHGGRVWAEGAVEKGATFYFTL